MAQKGCFTQINIDHRKIRVGKDLRRSSNPTRCSTQDHAQLYHPSQMMQGCYRICKKSSTSMPLGSSLKSTCAKLANNFYKNVVEFCREPLQSLSLSIVLFRIKPSEGAGYFLVTFYCFQKGCCFSKQYLQNFPENLSLHVHC